MTDVTNAAMRVGMIGVGNYGAARRDSMRKSGLFDIVAAYDINAKALAGCRQVDGAAPTASYEELLARSDIEAMVISTGAKFHCQQLVAAAERGLHVFIEKPLCSTMGELERILKVQARTGVVIGLGHADHTSNAVSRITKDKIDSGQLGQIVAFEQTTAHNGAFNIKPGDWRGDPEKNPGGMLFQCGVHGYHELMYYFGPIRRVSAMMRHDVCSTGTADVAMTHLEFESGLIGSLNAYHVTPYRHTLSIFGTESNLYRNDRAFEEGVLMHMQTTRLDGAYEPYVPVSLPSESDSTGSLRSFFKAVRQGGSPYPGLIDGANALAAVFAAVESVRQDGRAIDIIRVKDAQPRAAATGEHGAP